MFWGQQLQLADGKQLLKAREVAQVCLCLMTCVCGGCYCLECRAQNRMLELGAAVQLHLLSAYLRSIIELSRSIFILIHKKIINHNFRKFAQHDNTTTVHGIYTMQLKSMQAHASFTVPGSQLYNLLAIKLQASKTCCTTLRTAQPRFDPTRGGSNRTAIIWHSMQL